MKLEVCYFRYGINFGYCFAMENYDMLVIYFSHELIYSPLDLQDCFISPWISSVLKKPTIFTLTLRYMQIWFVNKCWYLKIDTEFSFVVSGNGRFGGIWQDDKNKWKVWRNSWIKNEILLQNPL